jgi:hypothetical protein
MTTSLFLAAALWSALTTVPLEPHDARTVVTSPPLSLIGDHRIRFSLPEGWKIVGSEPRDRWPRTTIYQMELSNGKRSLNLAISTYPVSRAERNRLFGKSRFETTSGVTGRTKTDEGGGRRTWWFAVRLPENTRRDMVPMTAILAADEPGASRSTMPPYVRDLFRSLVVLGKGGLAQQASHAPRKRLGEVVGKDAWLLKAPNAGAKRLTKLAQGEHFTISGERGDYYWTRWDRTERAYVRKLDVRVIPYEVVPLESGMRPE